MTDWLAQHCRFSEEYNAAYRIFSSATVGSQRKASLRYCPGQTTTILISGFSFARSKKRAENLRRRSSALGAGDRTRTGTVLLPGDFKSPVSTIPPHRRISAGIIVPHTGGKVKGFSKIYFKGRGICNWTAHGGCCKKGRTKARRNMVRCSFFDFFCLRPPGILAELAFLPQIL